MDKSKKDLGNGITAWLTLQSIVFIVASILSFLFVIFSSTIFFDNEIDPMVLAYMAGTIIPMCAILGALSYVLSKHTYRNVSKLTDAIEKVANGDFDVQLNEDNAGIFQGVYQDFNKMNVELQNVHMLRNDFINSYSHEFKTPITSIQGFAELLLDTDVTEEERRNYLQIIRDESARLANLANSTILLSKLDSQQIIEDKKPYRLDEQLRKCIIILSTSWLEKNITFSGELDKLTYNGNEQLMQHLWLNLISNAIKFTPENGTISVDLNRQNGAAVVKILDSGIGMNAETQAHIFDKYYQNANSQFRQGLGLGLSIVKRIIDMCGGKIELESTEGEVSTFIVTLS